MSGSQRSSIRILSPPACFLGVILLASGAVTAQQHCATQENGISVRMVSYNTHLLPDLAAKVAGKRGASKYRAKAIGVRLAEFDLVGVCEAFDRNYTRLLRETLQSNSKVPLAVVYGPGRSGRHLIGSGLLLFSRWPIEHRHTLTYSAASRFMNSGFKADGFAAKGALHVCLRLDEGANATLDCFLTHLESRSARARAMQIEELSEFIAKHTSSEVPFVVMGDFNIEADDAELVPTSEIDTPYQRLRASLSHKGRQLVDVEAYRSHGPYGTSDALEADGARRIDYIFVSSPTSEYASRLEPIATSVLPMLDQRVPEGSLSDHLAVACEANFRCLPTVLTPRVSERHRPFK